MESDLKDSIDTHGDFSSVFALFQYSKEQYKELFFSIILVIFSAALLMGSAKFMGTLAELLIQKSWDYYRIALTVSFILALELINIVIYYQGRVRLSHVTNQVALQVRRALFKKLTLLPISYFDNQALGRTITRLTADVEGIESFFSGTLPRVLIAVITTLSVFLAMILTDLRIGIVISLSSLPALVFTIAMRKPVRKWLQIYKRRSANLNAQLAEYLNGLSVIKAFGLEEWTEKTFQNSSLNLLQSAFMMMNWNSFIRPIAALLCSFPIVVILFWGGHQVIDGSISIGLLVAFIRYGERFFKPIMQLSFELHLIQDAISSSERVRKLLDEPEEVTELGISGAFREPLTGNVQFKAVAMGYSKQSLILKGLSFDVPAGTSIGLVGRTGSGKSTTVNLISQLYPMSSGQILIDGKDLLDWDRTFLRSQIGVISQDVIIFHGSIRENLLITAPDPFLVSDEDIKGACHKTGFQEIIDKLPLGLHTILTDGGSNLSMGERQLLSFTRLILRNPKILILDEATANIDEHCEVLIQNAISEILSHRTCFIIAHRLSTIKHCDQILVLDDGLIAESGSHEELMMKKGTYFNLVSRQLQA